MKLAKELEDLGDPHHSFAWLKRGADRRRGLLSYRVEADVAAMAEINDAKAKLLYEFIDNSKLYRNDVQTKYRSCMNVPFFLRDESLNAAFLAESQAVGLAALKGHKMVGGMRASIYNAVSMDSVQALVKFMGEFEKHHA